MRVRFLILFSCFPFALFLSSCSETPRPALALITEVGPPVVEPGDMLEIAGKGFVEGRVRVSLKGEIKPDGLGAPVKKYVVLHGTATSEGQLNVPLPSDAIRDIVKEPGRFNGTVEVEFKSLSSGVRIVAAKTDVSIDFMPGGVGVTAVAERERAAFDLLGELGMTIIDSRDVDGVVVGEVRRNTPAHAAGISFGDRLLTVNGVSVSAVADLAGISPTGNNVFDIASCAGVIRQIPLHLESSPRIDGDELTAILLASVAFGFFIALAAPRRRRIDTPRMGVSDLLSRALGVGLVGLLIIAVPAAAVILKSLVLVPVILFGMNALGLTMLFLTSDPAGRTIVPIAFGVLLVPVLFVVSGYLGSSLEVTDIVSGQRGGPFGFHLTRGPFAVLLAVSSLFVLWPVQPANPAYKRLSSAAAWMSALSTGGMLTIGFLGGWLVPFIDVAPGNIEGPLLAASCLVFLGKTWFVILTARWLASYDAMDRRAPRKPRAPWIPMTAIAVGSIASVAWAAADIPATLISAGRVLAAAMVATLLTALIALFVRSALFGSVLPKNVRYLNLDASTVDTK